MKYKYYEDSRREADELIEEGKIQEAISLYENIISSFKDNYYEISIQLSLLYCLSKKYKEALQLLIEGNEKGYYYTLPFEHKIYKPLQKLSDYERFIQTNEKIKKEKIDSSEAIYKISLPDNYSPLKKYPLFLAFHGTGDNIENFSKRWRSEKLSQKYLIAYIQSSKIYGTKGFSWDHECLSGRKDIEKCYEDIIKKYPVNKKEVYAGGFSTGGMMALDIAINQILPIKQFTVLCPIKPVSLNEEAIKSSALVGIEGNIIVGDDDFMLPVQKRMFKSLNDNRLKIEFIEIAGLGHELPNNLPDILDSLLK